MLKGISPRPIVDSHIHYWDPAQLTYAWLQDVPAINRAFLPGKLAQATTAVNLQKIVFVQADCVPEDGLREVAWVTRLARPELLTSVLVAIEPVANVSWPSGR